MAENQSKIDVGSSSAGMVLLYVLAGSWNQAVWFAEYKYVQKRNLRYISDSSNLCEIDGKRKTLFVLSTARDRQDYFECLDLAQNRGFTIEHMDI